MSDLPDTSVPDGVGRIVGAIDWSPLCEWIRELLETICS